MRVQHCQNQGCSSCSADSTVCELLRTMQGQVSGSQLAFTKQFTGQWLVTFALCWGREEKLMKYHTVLLSRSHHKERWQPLISSSLIGGSAVYSIDVVDSPHSDRLSVSFTEQPRCRPLSSRPTGGAGGWQWRRLLRTCCVRPCCLAGAPCSSCWRGRASTPTCAQVQSASISF